MAKKIIKTKQIAFNLANPKQRELYEYVAQFDNFSKYGRKVIEKDMKGAWSEPQENLDNIDIDVDVLQGFI